MADAPPASTALAVDSRLAVAQRREAVLALLTQRFADDVLDVDELEQRLGAAHAATSLAALDALVADLGPAVPPAPTTALAPVSGGVLVRDDPHRRATATMWAVFGGVDRRGSWQVPRRMNLRCIMGGGHLDFREAEFGPGVTELHVRCVMGGLELIVPPGLQLDVDVSAVLGGVENRHQVTPAEAADPNRPILRITGLAVLGGLEIQTRRTGESRGDAKRRVRNARRAARLPADRDGTRPALPRGDGD